MKKILRHFRCEIRAKGEEYPLFKHFWIERPSLHQKSIVVHALLDSKSVAGAYRLDIHPGSPTWMDIDVILFPRTDIQCVGLAPLTSMFMHSPMDAPDKADYRSAVHDSEALAMTRGNGEQIWRPLNNPHKLQVSSFVDENPLGFGLIQSHRRLDHYQDLEAKYHRRPSAWVEPLGNWGKGRVELIEIAPDSEANDNIVVFWRPEEGLKKGRRFSCSYRLTWPDDAPVRGDQILVELQQELAAIPPPKKTPALRGLITNPALFDWHIAQLPNTTDPAPVFHAPTVTAEWKMRHAQSPEQLEKWLEPAETMALLSRSDCLEQLNAFAENMGKAT